MYALLHRELNLCAYGIRLYFAAERIDMHSDGFQINSPKAYFNDLGGLHDARIEKFSWRKQKKQFLLMVDDLNSCFFELPEYQGLRPAELIFSGVHSLRHEFQISSESFSIFGIEIIDSNEDIHVQIKCSPGGLIEMVCTSIEVRNLNNSGSE